MEKWMHKQSKPIFARILILTAGIGLLAFALAGLVHPAAAARTLARQTAKIALPAADNSACLSCHSQPGLSKTMPSGETLSLTIDQNHFSTSVHSDLKCTDCHTGITTFPHAELRAQSLRALSLEYYVTCQRCHPTQYSKTLDSVHQKALSGGNLNAAICTDCHNPHTQAQITEIHLII